MHFRDTHGDRKPNMRSLSMAKKLLVLLTVLTLVMFVACKKEETTNIDATTDTAMNAGTTESSTTEYSTDTIATDTVSTDTITTDTMSTDTSGTAGTTSVT